MRSRTVIFSGNVANKKLTECTTNHFYKQPFIDGIHLDGDIVRRIQADSFTELWAWKSTI